MSALSDLSLRWKIPLRVMGAVLGTALAVTGALVAREYEEIRQNLEGHARSMGRVLAHTLIMPVLHDDIWRAYEILQSAHERDPAAPELQAEVVLVTDADFRVFVSTRPREFPIGSSAASRGGAYGLLRAELSRGTQTEQRVLEPVDSPVYFVMSPLIADGVALGHVILGYSKTPFLPRFLGLVGRAALVTLVVLAVILPISWFWSRRTGQPLLRLAEAMRHVPVELEAAHLADLPHSRDEIGQLGSAFRRMVGELRNKQELERQMLVSERLAAIGRLTAGIAHEINNPLAGMLTAINTYKRHGGDDPLAAKTLSLLERGLTQIRNTVAALLVESRVEDRPFAPQDIDDLLILVEAEAHACGTKVVIDGMLGAPLPLPATLVRQIILNLLLNAVAAAGNGGIVRLHAHTTDDSLTLAVFNDGRHIPAEELPYLFEPFTTHSGKGHGLGLWIVYQIVQQLDGEISVDSAPDSTTFTIEVPYGSASRSPAAALSD
ncbi:MAG TPA: HAMP domain-containing sensor histidine kinase [Aromatoleum sp.]|uniref:sensor histidine kinase n=1 Tax=Aromatoleum sp. TaxID=2307007 RepID=UPI002B466E27|nr:HAMP domain-containing sensor histidine kinase [Aromatoleum sp.]HJV24459.1 HAMP domain-containing sensor histidine kinase [Aromatoleum sp.]